MISWSIASRVFKESELRYLILFFGTCALTLAGCGGDGRPSLVPVEGTITLNGETLAEAQIGFLPVDQGDYKRPSNAISDASGKFRIGTYGKDDGIPVGKYKVTVTKVEMMGEPPEGFNPEDPAASSRPTKQKRIVPIEYSDPNESGITVEVTSEGLQPATIDISSDGPTIEMIGGGGGV